MPAVVHPAVLHRFNRAQSPEWVEKYANRLVEIRKSKGLLKEQAVDLVQVRIALF